MTSGVDDWTERLRRSPYSSTSTYGRKKVVELLDREIASLPDGARALDVGCGAGYDLRHMRERGLEVVGVEPDAGRRARASAANPGVDVVDGLLERLPFLDRGFDLACALDVLPHCAEPERGIAELARVLRPGGTAFVTGAPRFALAPGSLWRRLGGRWAFTAGRAIDLFRSAGFGDVWAQGVFFGAWGGLGRLSSTALSKALRAYEPLDDWLAERPAMSDLANRLVVVARR